MARRRLLQRESEYVCRPIYPNAGIAASYRRALLELVDEMHNSVIYWITACYRANEPEMAQDGSEVVPLEPAHRVAIRGVATDASPAVELRRAVRRLVRRWQRNFNLAAPRLARYFALQVHKRTDAQLRSILKAGGFTVEFKMTPAMNDVLQATLGANVGLIRTIPQEYLAKVEGAVLRSVQTGRDLAQLTKEIRNIYPVTRNRAVLIARDQNNKATSAMQEARRLELGITEAIWLHSHGGKEPRPTHLANHNKRYDVQEGWYDPDPRVRRRIHPGELINCRCVSRSVVPGLT